MTARFPFPCESPLEALLACAAAVLDEGMWAEPYRVHIEKRVDFYARWEGVDRADLAQMVELLQAAAAKNEMDATDGGGR